MKTSYGLLISVTSDSIKDLEDLITDSDADESHEVVVEFNGDKKFFTFREFLSRFGFEYK